MMTSVSLSKEEVLSSKIQIFGFDDKKEFVDNILDQIFDYFKYLDHTFSTYKLDSEISKLNRKEIKIEDVSEVIKEIFKLSDEYKIKTNGYFDIYKWFLKITFKRYYFPNIDVFLMFIDYFVSYFKTHLI